MVFSLTAHPASPVGCADLLLRRGGPEGTGQVLARLYYPASAVRKYSFFPLSCPAWLPHPRGLDSFLAFVLSDLDTGLSKKPQSLLLRLFRATLVRVGGFVNHLLLRVPAVWHAQPCFEKPMRAALLSHGLGGTRAVYSSHALSLASQGWLVVAAEHADGTASLTCSFDEDGGRSWRSYAGCGLKGKRHPRVALRCEELSALTDVLCALAAGSALPHSALLLNASSQELLQQLSGRVDVSQLAVLGHSFGGATALAFTRRDARVSSCVAHDPWLPALTGAPASHALTPWHRPSSVLITLCEDWMADGTHMPADLRAALGAIRSAGGDAKCVGLRGCNHHTVSDVPLLTPSKRRGVLRMQREVFEAVEAWLDAPAAARSRMLNRYDAPSRLLPVLVVHGEEETPTRAAV